MVGIDAIVSAIIANLLVLQRQRPKGSRVVVGTKRLKQTRYDRKGLRKLPDVIEVLEAAGFVTIHPAVFKQRRTTIEATENLKSIILRPEVSLSDITRADGEELILVRARPEVSHKGGKKQPNVPIDYEDTAESRALRSEMEEINRFLASRSVVLLDEPQPLHRLVRVFTKRHAADPLCFNLHGRLYGGFWMGLKATERHRLRFDGESIADLDFSSMFPNLAYRHIGMEPPVGDLYAIPGLENHRDGAKAALSALLSYEHEMRALPSRLKKLLPDGWTASRVKQAFAEHHPALVPLFGRDFGLDLMFTESRILLTTLRRLMDQSIPALPMHDGIMVPRSKSGEGIEAMEEASLEIIGIKLSVTTKA